MRSLPALLAAGLVLACAGEPEPETPPPPPPPTWADFAGTWSAMSHIEGTPDPVPSRFQGHETGGWVMLLEGRDPVPLTVSIKGDSLIAISGQYPSILRKDVMVTVRTAGVLQDGRLVGKLVATYDSPDGQELVTGTFEADRVPEGQPQ